MNYNRANNLGNPHQGTAKRVLALCSAGLLRSPTVAWVLSNDPWNYNTRAAGVDAEYALIPVEEGLLSWAQEIICVEPSVKQRLDWFVAEHKIDLGRAIVVTLKIPDMYPRRSPKLVHAIIEQYTDFQHGRI
jgi:predicted protein tyrosine phosphatase